MIHADLLLRLLIEHTVSVTLLAYGALLTLTAVLTFAYRRLGE